MLGQPSFDCGMLVGGVVVSDQVQVEAVGRAAVDEPQEFEPFLVTMALHAFADHFAGGDIEDGEQRCRSMPFVVMGHRSRPPPLHRQARLSAIQGLDLTFLVDRQHQRPVRRIKIETNDVRHLLDEPLVVRQLERLDQMGLQTMRRPDALNARWTQRDPLGELAHRPMRARHRLLVQRHANDPLDHARRQRRFAAGRVASRSSPATPWVI